MGVINQAQSAVLSSILDFTNKEMTRMRNERVVFDLVKGAQMTRWGRESREGGLRQKELRRRRQHEEMLKTVITFFFFIILLTLVTWFSQLSLRVHSVF